MRMLLGMQCQPRLWSLIRSYAVTTTAVTNSRQRGWKDRSIGRIACATVSRVLTPSVGTADTGSWPTRMSVLFGRYNDTGLAVVMVIFTGHDGIPKFLFDGTPVVVGRLIATSAGTRTKTGTEPLLWFAMIRRHRSIASGCTISRRRSGVEAVGTVETRSLRTECTGGW